MWTTDAEEYFPQRSLSYDERLELARRRREHSDEMYRRDRWQHEHGGFGSRPPEGWVPQWDGEE